MEITKDTKEFGFKLTVPKIAPAGQHRNLFCQVVLTHQGEPVVANTGYSELRIDVPIPPKAGQPPPTPMPVVVKQPDPAKPPEKRLTRLEKLRLEQQEREKTLQEGAAPKK